MCGTKLLLYLSGDLGFIVPQTPSRLWQSLPTASLRARPRLSLGEEEIDILLVQLRLRDDSALKAAAQARLFEGRAHLRLGEAAPVRDDVAEVC